MASVSMFYRIILVYFLFFLSCVVVGKVSLGQKRIISEFKDIMSSGLSLNVPFNNSREEVLLIYLISWNKFNCFCFFVYFYT